MNISTTIAMKTSTSMRNSTAISRRSSARISTNAAMSMSMRTSSGSRADNQRNDTLASRILMAMMRSDNVRELGDQVHEPRRQETIGHLIAPLPQQPDVQHDLVRVGVHDEVGLATQRQLLHQPLESR
ncbi:unnamed protein product [Prorocentrum cordatum]|uniref:Uncharacterized protein n=1 Tax=Prorocentrum cordatum TaxID=2364126 RepID=A0ABN9PQB5_9DINO|nr:unnamed protein product [Polarella glacialis]